MDYQKMYDELRNAFSTNKPIKVHVIENGRMVVKEISPDSLEYSEMYIKESQYLREKVNGSSVDSIMNDVKTQFSDELESELDSMMDEIHGIKNGDSVLDDKEVVDGSKTSEPSVEGATIDEPTNDDEASSIVSDKIDITNFFRNASLKHKFILTSLFFKHGVDNIWKEILTALDSKSISIDEYKKFVDDLTVLYDKSEIDNLGLFNDEYKQVVSKYPVEEELSVKLSSIISYARNGFKAGISALIDKYGIDNIWMDIADELKAGKIGKKDFDEFVHNLKGIYSKDECDKLGIFSSNHFKELVSGNILYKTGPEPLDVLDKDKIDHESIPSKADGIVSKVLGRRAAKVSLKDRFLKQVGGVKEWWGGLSPKRKCIIVGATIAVVGIGVIAISAPMIKNILENTSGSLNVPVKATSVTPSLGGDSPVGDSSSFLQDMTGQLKQSVNYINDTVRAAHETLSEMSASGFDLSSIGEGHIGYKTAADAINRVNGVILNSNFGKEPTSNIVDVYNVITGWMHLSKEQLSDPEFMKSLAQDPNNAIHIKDAWFNLSDIVNEFFKGGMVL